MKEEKSVCFESSLKPENLPNKHRLCHIRLGELFGHDSSIVRGFCILAFVFSLLRKILDGIVE